MNTFLKTNKPLLSIVAFGLIAIGAVVYFRSQQSQTMAPHRGDIVESIYGLGTVVPDSEFRARVGVNLTLEKLFVREGDAVRAGDSLIKFDGTIVRSPISGTVTEVLFKDGEMAPAQGTLLTVVNLESLYLEVSLEQQSVLRIRKGQKVLVTFESLRNEKLDGQVSAVFPRQNQFIVRIELTAWPAGVLPGMTADVAILVGNKSQALLIPLKAIVAGQVTRIREGKKTRVPVRLDTINGEWGELISGDIRETDELLIRR